MNVNAEPVVPAAAPPASAAPVVFGEAVKAAPATPAAAATPPPTNSYAATDWRHSLPDDVREEPSLKNMLDVQTLTKSYLHAQKAMGADKVPLPGKHATEEDWQRFYDATGRPPLDKYEIKAPKDAKFVDPEFLKKLAPVAHKVGVNPSQLEKILEFYEGETKTTFEAKTKEAETQLKTQIDGLKTEWGKAYDQRVKWAAKFVEEKGGPEFTKFFNDHNVGQSPDMVRFFAKLGEEAYKEDSIDGGAGGKPMLDPKGALQAASAIQADSKHPYNDKTHPNHLAAVAEVNQLYAMAYPSSEKGA